MRSGPFVVVLLLAAVSTAATPSLLPWVATGVVAGALPELVRLAKHRRRAAIGVAVVAVFGWLVWSLGPDIHFSVAPPPIEIPSALTVDVEYESAERFRVTKRIEALRSDIKAMAAEAGTSSGALRAALRKEFVGEGWTVEDSTLRMVLTEITYQPVEKHPFVPAEKTNEVFLFVPEAVLYAPRRQTQDDARRDETNISFAPTRPSEARIIAPTRAIDATDPPSGDPGSSFDGRETRTVQLRERNTELGMEVRSKPFRAEALAAFADVTAGKVFAWLVTTLLTLANESFREWLKKVLGRGDGVPSATAPTP